MTAMSHPLVLALSGALGIALGLLVIWAFYAIRARRRKSITIVLDTPMTSGSARQIREALYRELGSDVKLSYRAVDGERCGC